jgi:hypothetical protein
LPVLRARLIDLFTRQADQILQLIVDKLLRRKIVADHLRNQDHAIAKRHFIKFEIG